MIVETLTVEACDLIVLQPVIDEHFAACISVIRKGTGPGADVGGVESFGDGGVVDVEVVGVVGGVIDHISEPALSKKRGISVRGH